MYLLNCFHVIGPDLNQKNVLVIIVVVSAVCGMLFLSLLCWWIFWKRGKKTSKDFTVFVSNGISG